MNLSLLKVLIVDDDEDDYFITKELIDEIPFSNIKVEWAPTIQEGLQSYMTGAHDIYFIDYLIGAKTGIDFLISAQESTIKNPIIMITGKGDHKVDKQAMAYGSADYLVKGEFDSEKLERTMRYALDRYLAGKQLAESEAKYRSIFEKSRDMIFIADAFGSFIDANDSSEKILGYTRDELLEMKIYELFYDENERIQFRELLNGLLEVVDFERTLVAKNGQKRICLISTILLEGADNSNYFQGVIHDITKRRKAELDLATAEKLAVTGRVVRMIGHEIRNPLTNINLSLEQIEADIKKTDDLEMYFDIIRRNAERINTLITELLNSSKPAQLTFNKVSINKITTEALDLVKDRLVLKQVTLRTYLADDLCDVVIDGEKVKFALVNILVNAIEATEEGNGVLEVKTKADGDYCIVEITDNGIGISSDTIHRIFDPFFSGKPKGTGLGLSTAYNIVRSHNGFIEVQSEVNKGTNFVVKFNFNRD